MRYSALLGVAILPLLVLAQDSVKIDSKWDKGSKAKYAFTYNFVMPDAEAVVTGSFLSEVKDAMKLGFAFEGVKVRVNDQDLEYTAEASDITLDKNGFLKNITGGIEGGDTSRIYLATLFVPPVDSLAKDASWKKSFEKNTELDLGTIDYEAKYLGSEKIGEVSAHKFSTSLKESGNNFSVTNTVWVDSAGKVLKLEGKFSNMPVPAAQQIAEGKTKLELVK